MRARTSHILAGVAVLTCMASTSLADNNAAAMVMRVEPADSGIAKVLRDGDTEEVAFMMPLYEGDELVVESPGTAVQVRVFGGEDVTVSAGKSLAIGAGAGERTLFSGMLSALSNKVFRNNQVSRRNLVTRSDGQLPDLVLHGIDSNGQEQALVAGRRSLLLRWNLDLESVSYRVEDTATKRDVASGTSDGDFAFIGDVDIVAGHAYEVTVAGADGALAHGALVGVNALPALTPIDDRLGAAAAALRLIELATRDDGRWKFEAIQGVLDLSPDDIDRATLIEEIAAL